MFSVARVFQGYSNGKLTTTDLRESFLKFKQRFELLVLGGFVASMLITLKY